MLEELPNGVCAVHLEPVVSAAELFQQAQVMKCAQINRISAPNGYPDCRLSSLALKKTR